MRFDQPTPDEKRRLATLDSLQILDTIPEERFDVVVAFAQARFGVDTAFIAFVDRDRVWVKAFHGPALGGMPRDISFCGHTVRADETLVVEDALADPRFAASPLVTGGPRIRFYAGAPLSVRNGQRVGTLCLVHRQPRRLSRDEAEELRALAEVVVLELEVPEAELSDTLWESLNASELPHMSGFSEPDTGRATLF